MKLKSQQSGGFTSGSEIKHILKIAGPSAVGLVSVFSFNIADTFFVARLGMDALVAISFTFPVVFLFIGVLIGLGIGASSVLSRLIGGNQLDRIASNATHSLLFAVLTVLLLTVLGIVTVEPLFRFMGAEGEILVLIEEYMVLWYISAAFLVAPIVGNQVMRADGHTIFPGVIMAVSSILNVALDPILIFGLWGAPELGIKGAAMASLIARVAAFILALSYLHYRTRLLCWKCPNFYAMGQDWKKLIVIAVPAMMENAILPITEWVLVLLLARFGSEAVASYGVISRVYSVIFVPYIALAVSITPFSGQNWGASSFQRIRNGLRMATIIASLWCVLSSVILFFSARHIVMVFTQSEQVISLAVLYLRWVPISYIGGAIVLIISSVFYGTGQPLRALGVQATLWFALYLPLAYSISFFFGVEGILLIESVANIGGGVMAALIFYFVQRNWEKPALQNHSVIS